MIFKTSTKISSDQALFDERSKNGDGGGSGDNMGILIDIRRQKHTHRLQGRWYHRNILKIISRLDPHNCAVTNYLLIYHKLIKNKWEDLV